jgi:hypothetical protein
MHGLHNFFLAYKSSNTIPLGSPTNRRTPHDLGGITSLTPYLSHKSRTVVGFSLQLLQKSLHK